MVLLRLLKLSVFINYGSKLFQLNMYQSFFSVYKAFLVRIVQ